MFGAFDVSTSGLTAQRVRLDTIASNIANVQTTHDTAGRPNPYRRMYPVFAAQALGNGEVGVQVAGIEQDPSDFKMKLEPGNPDGDAQGWVKYPNVELSTEFVNALEATRAYEANITAIETTKSMMTATLRVLA